MIGKRSAPDAPAIVRIVMYLLSIFFVTFMSAGVVTAVLLTGVITAALVVLRIGVARRGR
jgi:hypothetical protein